MSRAVGHVAPVTFHDPPGPGRVEYTAHVYVAHQPHGQHISKHVEWALYGVRIKLSGQTLAELAPTAEAPCGGADEHFFIMGTPIVLPGQFFAPCRQHALSGVCSVGLLFPWPSSLARGRRGLFVPVCKPHSSAHHHVRPGIFRWLGNVPRPSEMRGPERFDVPLANLAIGQLTAQVASNADTQRVPATG
jgi:hypothetical protein